MEQTHKTNKQTRWNYKKANWPLYRHRTSILTKSIKFITEIWTCYKNSDYVLEAAKECTIKGDRKYYNPYGNEDLNNKTQWTDNSKKSRRCSTIALKQTNTSSLRQDMKPEVSGWRKTASLNMKTDGNKLWRLTKQLNDEEDRYAKITLL